MQDSFLHDTEKNRVDVASDSLTEPGEVDYQFSAFHKFEHWASHTLRAEIRGIERVPEKEKTDKSYWNAASMWMGGNMVVSTFSLGLLGIGVFDLTFWDSVCTIIFFNILGALPVAFYSTFGPRFGLRQMVLSRFWFGYQGVRVIALLNCIACIGWTSVNTIVSAQLLNIINPSGLPPWAAVLIIVVITMFVTFFGYRIVHIFEKWSWVPTFIVFIIVAVRMGKSHQFTAGELFSGPVEAGSVLSFGATVFGYATGWSSYASDYTAYMPVDSNPVIIFFGVLIGLSFPLIFSMILGAACMSGTLGNPDWLAAYEANEVGGILSEVMVNNSLHGFGKFCLVVLALSIVANNVPNLYSLGLSAQTMWSGFRRFPRLGWTILGSGIAIGIAIPGYYHFATAMQNFMSLIGYWLAIYHGVALCDHFVYRKGFSGYQVEDYNDRSRLAHGMAGIFAFCCGVMGAVLGMSQVWYVGVIARKIGDPVFGADIGFELAFGFSFVAYALTRWLEIKYFR